jgi:hypothetical protein
MARRRSYLLTLDRMRRSPGSAFLRIPSKRKSTNADVYVMSLITGKVVRVRGSITAKRIKLPDRKMTFDRVTGARLEPIPSHPVFLQIVSYTMDNGEHHDYGFTSNDADAGSHTD